MEETPLEKDPQGQPNRRVVIALHGIRTRGTWQKQLAPLLADRGFIPELLDYGWFSALPFLIPFMRNRKIEWFRREVERIETRYPGVRPSVIAHSFGSYLVCRALQKYAGLVAFDRVILCGSIVRRDYDWPLVYKNRWINHALNDCGRLDVWAGNVQRLVGDAGPSGKFGFEKDKRAPCLTERFHPEWGHSDFFFFLNFEKRWIPFLEGHEVPDAEFPSQSQVPTTLVLLLIAIAISALALFAFYSGWFEPHPPKETIFTGVRTAGIYLTQGGGGILNLPIRSKNHTAPKELSCFFSRSQMQYQAIFGSVGIPISVLPEEFVDPSQEQSELHVAVFDFDDDGNPEFIYALFDKESFSVSGCVIKFHPPANSADAARPENFAMAGKFSGQHWIMVSKNRIFCPIGSQIGPYDGNDYKFYQNKLREWDNEENRFIEDRETISEPSVKEDPVYEMIEEN